MNKKQRIEWIHLAVKASGKPYKVLDEGNDGPRHIRVEGVGDIWPSTGTYSVKGKFKKGNPQAFLSLCGASLEAPKKQSKYDQLEKRTTDLEEYCAFLEQELESIRESFGIAKHQ